MKSTHSQQHSPNGVDHMEHGQAVHFNGLETAATMKTRPVHVSGNKIPQKVLLLRFAIIVLAPYGVGVGG